MNSFKEDSTVNTPVEPPVVPQITQAETAPFGEHKSDSDTPPELFTAANTDGDPRDVTAKTSPLEQPIAQVHTEPPKISGPTAPSNVSPASTDADPRDVAIRTAIVTAVKVATEAALSLRPEQKAKEAWWKHPTTPQLLTVGATIVSSILAVSCNYYGAERDREILVQKQYGERELAVLRQNHERQAYYFSKATDPTSSAELRTRVLSFLTRDSDPEMAAWAKEELYLARDILDELESARAALSEAQLLIQKLQSEIEGLTDVDEKWKKETELANVKSGLPGLERRVIELEASAMGARRGPPVIVVPDPKAGESLQDDGTQSTQNGTVGGSASASGWTIERENSRLSFGCRSGVCVDDSTTKCSGVAGCFSLWLDCAGQYACYEPGP